MQAYAVVRTLSIRDNGHSVGLFRNRISSKINVASGQFGIVLAEGGPFEEVVRLDTNRRMMSTFDWSTFETTGDESSGIVCAT